MTGTVTIREGIRDSLIGARPGGLTMAAIAGTVQGPWRSRDVDEQVRRMWETNELARRPDGTFALTEKVLATEGKPGHTRARRGRASRDLDRAVSRVAAENRREGYDATVRTRKVDPALLRGGWCPSCRKTVTPRLDGTCPTCSTQTGAAAAVGAEPPKPRRRSRRKPLTENDPGYGVVCRCGGIKSKQAHRCRACQRARPRPRGRQLGPRPEMRKPRCITEELLQEARRLYASGKSLNEVAAAIHERTSYKTERSCSEGLYSLFKTRGWPLRPQGAVTAARNYRHGRKSRSVSNEQQTAYRHWLANQRGWDAIQGPGRPICKSVKQNSPGKGKPCEHRAVEGSEFCWAHDPRYELERQAQAARMRARASRQPMLPARPFISWLQRLHAELGTWARVAELVGMHASQANNWGRGRANSAGRPLEEISVRVIRRSAESANTTIGAIYGDVAEFAAVA